MKIVKSLKFVYFDINTSFRVMRYSSCTVHVHVVYRSCTGHVQVMYRSCTGHVQVMGHNLRFLYSRYGISAAKFGEAITSKKNVNAYVIFIGSLGDQASRLSHCERLLKIVRDC